MRHGGAVHPSIYTLHSSVVRSGRIMHGQVEPDVRGQRCHFHIVLDHARPCPWVALLDAALVCPSWRCRYSSPWVATPCMPPPAPTHARRPMRTCSRSWSGRRGRRHANNARPEPRSSARRDRPRPRQSFHTCRDLGGRKRKGVGRSLRSWQAQRPVSTMAWPRQRLTLMWLVLDLWCATIIDEGPR